MDKLKAWWTAHKPTRRRLIQVYAALLYNAHVKGFIEGEIYTGPLKNVCVPGFNCYSCPGAVGACPLGALQNALASSGNRAPAYVLGILLLLGLTLGRTICGWLCPLGLIQELLHKIPVPKLRKNRFTRVLSWLKYVILAIFVVIIPLSYAAQKFPVPAFCKYICPAGTFEGAIGLLANPANADKFSMLGILFTRKFVIMVAIFASCAFAYRAFCRFMCPLGAIYGLFARISLLGVKVDAGKCTDCGRCVSHCKVDIRHVGDHECIQCGGCIGECPTGAISWKGGKLALRGSEVSNTSADSKRRRTRSVVCWGLALALLAGVMWFVNKPENNNKPAAPQPTATVQTTEAATTTAPEPTVSTTAKAAADQPSAADAPTQAPAQEAADAQVGSEVGMMCPDFTVPLYGADGGEFSLSACKGKPVVINFWATWCTPCVNELPHFQKIYDELSDKIELVAIHSELITDDVQEYLDGQGYTMPFALDSDGSVIASLGGSTMLPMTVVVDAEGRIVYNKVGSITYELLKSLIEPLID